MRGVKITSLGKNLYEVKISWWKWSARDGLEYALLQLQNEGKEITAISRHQTGSIYFLVCTK